MFTGNTLVDVVLLLIIVVLVLAIADRIRR